MSTDFSLTTSITDAHDVPSTPKTAKRPGPMAFANFGGTDPFPSCGSPYTEELARTNKMRETVFNSLALADEEAEEESKLDLGGSKRRPVVALELDESVTAGGADPMPSWETRRMPGAEPNPWDDDDFDPAHETAFENFDDEDEHLEVLRQSRNAEGELQDM